jgi:peptidoglycan/LPS O-acetylase OafA/YrhL
MHIKALDGIRGLAALLVVLFHYGYAPFGWIGVQVFFVLSGFLITSILLKTKELPLAAYLGRFYWRRSLRIFPLYLSVMLVAAMVYAIWRVPSGYLLDLPYLATYTTNFGRLRQSDIDPAFVHLWSLAVEEQFYLIWPLLIYATPQRHLKKMIATIIISGPLIRLVVYYCFRENSEVLGRAIYSLPFTQFDAFAFGAAIIVWEAQKIGNAGRLFLVSTFAMGALGALTILYMHFFGGGAYKGSLGYAMYLLPLGGFVWGYSLIGLVSMFGIICALQRLPFFKIFENRTIVYIGTISYGVYVFHVPLLEIIHPALGHGPIVFPFYVALVILVASASFRWLETPFLRLKDQSEHQENVRPF